MGYIYMFTHRDSDMSYIGLCSHDYGSRDCRVKQHLRQPASDTPKFHNAIKKYGPDAFDVEILHNNVPDDMLDELEIKEIKERNTLSPNGYNLTTGGRKSTKMAEEVKEKQPRRSKSDVWNHSDDIISFYMNDKLTMTEIAEKFDVSQSTIKKILDHHNIDKRDIASYKKWKKYPKTEKVSPAWKYETEIVEMYSEQKMTLKTLSEHFDVSTGTIQSILEYNNIEIRNYKEAKKHGKFPKRSHVWQHQDKIIEMYCEQKMSVNSIAIHLDVSSITIQNILDSNDIKAGTINNKRSHAWQYQKEIIEMYCEQKKSMKTVAEKFETSVSVIKRILKANNIKTRTLEEARCNVPKTSTTWQYESEIVEMYCEQNVSINKLKDIFKTSQTTILSILKANNIETRSLKESMNIRYSSKQK